MADPIDMAKMRKELIDDEGLKLKAYRDSRGLLTIGVGRLIDSRGTGGLSPHECMYLLDNDIQARLVGLQQLSVWKTLSENRRRALVNMSFQLGLAGIQEFSTFLGLLEQGRYKEAGEDLRGTKWAKQVPARANRIVKMITEG